MWNRGEQTVRRSRRLGREGGFAVPTVLPAVIAPAVQPAQVVQPIAAAAPVAIPTTVVASPAQHAPAKTAHVGTTKANAAHHVTAKATHKVAPATTKVTHKAVTHKAVAHKAVTHKATPKPSKVSHNAKKAK